LDGRAAAGGAKIIDPAVAASTATSNGLATIIRPFPVIDQIVDIINRFLGGMNGFTDVIGGGAGV